MKKKYDFGIVCALPKELAALKLVFDFQLIKEHESFSYSEGIINAGSGLFRCVFATSGMGEINASILVKDMLDHFNVDRIIFTGIALGVPRRNKGEDHVRLGDIVISKNIVKISRGPIKKGGINYHADFSSQPSKTMLNAAEHLISDFTSFRKQPWERFISSAIKINRNFSRPTSKEARDIFIDETGKKRRKHPINKQRINEKPFPRIGNIGSSPNLLKHHKTRSTQAEKYQLYAIEMESGGIADTVCACEKQYVAIQGICDYGDKLKKDAWQNYAALASAAFAKALILTLTPTKKTNPFQELSTVEKIKKIDVSFGNINIAKYNYKLRRQSIYKNQLDILLNSDKDTLLKSDFYCKREYYDIAINKELRGRGIAVVSGPQLIGKNLLIKSFAQSIKNCDFIDTFDLAQQIIGLGKLVPRNSLHIIDIYAHWGQFIIKALIRKKRITEKELSDELKALYSNSNAFKQEFLKLSRSRKFESNLEKMLEIIERYLHQMRYSGTSILAIHLEDLQDYLNDRLFREIIEDIKPIFYLKLDEDHSYKPLQKIKLIISTRYFPAYPNNTIRVSSLSKTEVTTMIAGLNENWDEKLTELIVNKVFETTYGHVWFLMRFLKLYLQHRFNGDRSHPCLLTKRIIENADLWCNDFYLTADEVISGFLAGCEKIKKSLSICDEYDLVMQKAKDFCNFEIHKELLINSTEYKNNPFLIQTGLLLSRLNEVKKDMGIVDINNKIIQQYFLPKLRRSFL